jgi:hypothetical protein
MMDNTRDKMVEVMRALAKPFPAGVICWKPQAISKDRKRGLAVPYADPRAYLDRLNEVVPGGWHSQAAFTVAGDKLVCVVHLTILGLTRYGDGEAELDDANAATASSAQGFKRASTAFGLGRYLYELATPWEEYDADRRQFSAVAQRRLRTLYLKATGEASVAQAHAEAMGAPEAEAAAEPPAETGGNGSDPELEAALAVTVPFGTHKGQPLRSLAQDGLDGARYLGWLAGHVKFSSGTFVPRYRRGQELQDAARTVWDSLTAETKEAGMAL